MLEWGPCFVLAHQMIPAGIIQIEDTFQSWNLENQVSWRTRAPLCVMIMSQALRSMNLPIACHFWYSRREMSVIFLVVGHARTAPNCCICKHDHTHSQNLHLWLRLNYLHSKVNKWKVEHVVSVHTSMVLRRLCFTAGSKDFRSSALSLRYAARDWWTGHGRSVGCWQRSSMLLVSIGFLQWHLWDMYLVLLVWCWLVNMFHPLVFAVISVGF